MDSLSNRGVYKIHYQNCNKFYIGKISRNLNKRNYQNKKDFKSSNTTNTLVSYNILTYHTFDFQNFAIFAFIHDKNKISYLSLRPTRQDMTQGQWPEGRIKVGITEGKAGLKPRLKHSRTLLVIGSASAMRAWWA